MADKKPTPDWERIERDYRAGIKTLRQIAEENGLSHVAINKRAKRDGWSRDLSAKITAKADELVTRAAVTKTVTAEQRVTEREVVDANAAAIVSVRLSHRKDIARGRSIVASMFEELELECGPANSDLLAQLGEMMREPDAYGADKLNDLYHKIISLPGRAKTMKDLGESLSKLVTLERQAFGMKDDDGGSRPGDKPSIDAAGLSDALIAELMNARRATPQ